jgi:8-amino-7-oxononanoate synthase
LKRGDSRFSPGSSVSSLQILIRMESFEQEFGDRLDALKAEGLYRELRKVESPQSPLIQVGGRAIVNFSSNDYLGLADHPNVKQAAMDAVATYGAGSGSARLICGNLAPHVELEEALAEFKSTEAALTFSSGYAAAVGTISALAGSGDVVVIDKLSHASLVDGARLSGAKLRVFAHNDLDSLEKILQWADRRKTEGKTSARSRTLIVTESVFSMDGDIAPLLNIAELKEKYGAWLMVDEAHATGLFGEHRRGLIEEFNLSGRVEVQMGTLGKALGSSGGYICGSRALVDYLINKARSYVFSTAPVPAVSGAATAAIGIVKSEQGYALCQRLWNCVDLIKNTLIRMGRELPPVRSAIIPLILGDERRAQELSARLLEAGVLIPAIRYPTVARGAARLRVTASAAHNADHLESLFTAFRELNSA